MSAYALFIAACAIIGGIVGFLLGLRWLRRYSRRLPRTLPCPNCDADVTRVPYDIGSGPEMCCPHCEWCWGADGQDLKPLDIEAILAEIPDWPPGSKEKS